MKKQIDFFPPPNVKKAMNETLREEKYGQLKLKGRKTGEMLFLQKG